MIFAEVKSLAVPEGDVAVISCASGILWQKNLFDGELIQGYINADTGVLYTSSVYLKCAVSKNFIPIFGGAMITVSNDKGYYCYVHEYDASYTFIQTQKTENSTLTARLHPNTRYIKIRSDYTLTQNDISVKYSVVLIQTAVVEEKLPDEYQSVAYLASDSSAYFDTGINGNNENLAIDITFTADKYVTYGAIYGNYVSDNHNGVRLIFAEQSNSLLSNMNTICTTRGNTTVTMGNLVGSVVHLYRDSTSFRLNGETSISVSVSKGASNDGNVALFNRSVHNPNTQRDIGLKIYSCKMYDNGIIVRNFVPCYRKNDGKPGMYDHVTKQFFTSEGTGEFLYAT